MTGERSEVDEQWPRIVQPVLVRSKHSICRMCTSSGKLQELIFTASKHGKYVFKLLHLYYYLLLTTAKNFILN